jgi:nucleoside-diphosphate-sugar epimerase
MGIKSLVSNTVTILGCGYLGTALADHCISEGWSVSALTRNLETAKNLRGLGVSKVVEANLQDDDWHSQLDPNQDFVVNCVGASSPDNQGYISSYIEGQDSVMKWLDKGKVGSFVFTSSISVYPQTEKRFVDETASCSGVSEKGGLLLAAEQKCFPPVSSVNRSFILRLAGLYGPDRHLLIDKVKNNQEFQGNADRILNLIHRDDAVKAILNCLEADESNIGRIYNVSDGSHSTRGQIVTWLAEKLQVPVPTFKDDDDEGAPNRKVSNNRILDELSWSPQFSNFQIGYDSILSSS